MKDFIDDFYSYDFTGILHNDESSDDSDIEVSPAVDKEITNRLIQQEAACIIIDDD